ncbi:hypothetical protein H4582DRAFT_1238605 [Lactarius indigo]|nr:hypothetical protein H4582DRAFT_1238605 [Lactarius indigo]
MSRRTKRRSDPEQGEQLSLSPKDELEEEARSKTLGTRLGPRGRGLNNSSNGEHNDFNDGANALWSLYSKEAQAHDEALFQGILAEMDGVPTPACLLPFSLPSSSTVLRIYNRILHNNLYITSSNRLRCSPDLTANRIYRPAGLYLIYSPTTLPSIQDIGYSRPSEQCVAARSRVQSLCSTSCDLHSTTDSILYGGLARVRSPFKASAISTIFFPRYLANAISARIVPLLIRFSLALFFIGLSISVINVNTFIGVITIIPICLYGLLSLYSTSLSLWHPSYYTRPRSRIR